MEIMDKDKKSFKSIDEIDFDSDVVIYKNGSCVNQLLPVGDKWGFIELRNPYGCAYYVEDTKEESIRSLLATCPSGGVHTVGTQEWMGALCMAYEYLNSSKGTL